MSDLPLSHAYAVIMAGGKGERFWPLSTERRPKQLLALAGGKPLVMQALDRLEGVVPPDHVLVSTNASLVEPIHELLGPDHPASVLGEPVGRDTAAAIAAAAAWILHRDPDAVFCVLTADHIIGDLPVFRNILRQALGLCAENDVLATIGIEPAFPSSGFGYIQTGEPWQTSGGVPFVRVRRFVEKPDVETARAYLASGEYAWNSGMFVWAARRILEAFDRFRPQLGTLVRAWAAEPDDAAFAAALARDFPGLEKISIDYAVMEKASNVVMCRGTFAWDDVGSWPALEAHLPCDGDRNAVMGDVELLDASSNIVVGSDDRLTALVGVDNLVVVQAPGVTLVCEKSKAQQIKALVNRLRENPARKPLL